MDILLRSSVTEVKYKIYRELGIHVSLLNTILYFNIIIILNFVLLLSVF